jgi:hypothetical protein
MKKIGILAMLLAMMSITHVHGQNEWFTFGNNVSGGEWFGADGTSTIPLKIKTMKRLSIDLFTEGRMRWQLLPIASLSPV